MNHCRTPQSWSLEPVAVQIAARQISSQTADGQGLIRLCKVLYRTLVIYLNNRQVQPLPRQPDAASGKTLAPFIDDRSAPLPSIGSPAVAGPLSESEVGRGG